MQWTRRRLLGGAAVAGAAAFLGRCAPAAPPSSAPAPTSPSSAPKPAGWDDVVAAARREGALTLYGPTGGPGTQEALTELFQQSYPGITVNATFLDQREQVSRVMAERTAGRYLTDVLVGGTTGFVVSLKQAGALVPLRPALVLPDVVDESGWLDGHLWWSDLAEPYVNLMYLGVVAPIVVNTRLVDPNQFTSFYDLLDPRWKGKMVATDIRNPGPGGVLSRFMYKNPALGPSYVERLFGEMDLTLSSDQRQIMDWVADGRFSIGLFVSTIEPLTAVGQGLPVTPIPGERFKEGICIGPENGSVSLVDSAPHPNAAKLYVNWLLSRDGQRAYQQKTQLPSLRTDVGRDGAYGPYVPKPGGTYVNGGTEEYSLITTNLMSELIGNALAKAGRQ
jgi:iron(III) transport system substrate-binding protein